MTYFLPGSIKPGYSHLFFEPCHVVSFVMLCYIWKFICLGINHWELLLATSLELEFMTMGFSFILSSNTFFI